MISLSIELVRYEKYEQYVIQDRDTLLIDYSTLAFLSKQATVSTQKTYCSILKKFLEWSQDEHFNLNENLSRGFILTQIEVASLSRKISNSGLLSNTTFASNLTVIAKYLTFQAGRYRNSLHYDSPIRQLLSEDEEVSRFKKNIQNEITKYKKKHRTVSDSRPKGLSLDEIHRLEALLSVASIENECRELWGKHARRNWLIVSFFYFYGLRASEVMQLKANRQTMGSFTDDFTLKVVPDATPEKDPRSVRPGFKTATRELPLEPILYQQVSAYVMNERDRVSQDKGIRNSDYLFITREGPVTYITLNRVVTQFLGELVGAKNTNPHCLRHTCASNFVRRFAEQIPGSIHDKQAYMHRLLSYWFGWAHRSAGSAHSTPTATLYTEMAIQEKINEVSLEHQASVLKQLGVWGDH